MIYTNTPMLSAGKKRRSTFSAYFAAVSLCLFLTTLLSAQPVSYLGRNAGIDVFEKGYRLYPAFPDSAIFYTKKILVPPENKNSSKFTEALLFLSNIYNYREEFDSIGKYARMALQHASLNDSLASGYRYIALNNLAGYYLLIGDFKQADLLYENSLLEHIPERDRARIFFNIGLTRKKQGDYQGALWILDQAEDISIHSAGIFRAEIFNLKSKIFIRMQNWEAARENNLRATQLLQPFSDEASLKKKLELAFGLGLIEISSGNHQKGFEAVRRGQKIQAQLSGYRTAITYGILARIYTATGRNDSAIYYGKIALDQMIGQLPDLPGHPLIAEAWLDLGNTQLNADLAKDARNSFFSGLECLISRKADAHNLPEAADITYPVEAVSLLRGMGRAARREFDVSGSTTDLLDAMDAFLLATRLIPRIYRDLQNEESRLFMAEHAVNTHEEAISVVLELAQQTGNSQYLETAFYLAEQNKAALLYYALQDAEKIQALGIPDSIIDRENAIKTELTFYQEKYFEESRRVVDTDKEKLARWKEKILHLESETRGLQQMILSNYPQYFQLKYQESEVSVAEARKLLPEDAALLEYFCGNYTAYLFLITADRLEVKSVPVRDSLEQWILAMRRGILQKSSESSMPESQLYTVSLQYITPARKLYESLIAPLEQGGVSLPRKLVIIPDDVLGYLPFDILLTETPEFPLRFRQFPYLIRRHEISYAYSTALLHNLEELSSGQPSPIRILAFGPWVGNKKPAGNSPDNQQYLSFSRDEITAIQSVFPGEFFMGTQATRERFLTLSKHFQIIHLATHTQINDEDSRYSRITFAPVSDYTRESDFLSIAEICNLRLKADMVVLSACETGVGKLQKGEGILSLARAFTYAGAKSIVTTLWQVDDQATAVVMKSFYQYLERGYPKDRALRQAKLDYLDNSDNRLAHPFFWGAAIPIGSMVAVRSSSRLIPVLLIISIVMIISGFFFVKKARIH
ncbi:MAG: CHAT domain-containing tetratricopeptide repeat protein [Bacteroidia bacterium]